LAGLSNLIPSRVSISIGLKFQTQINRGERLSISPIYDIAKD
jgi:hypothetical protein